MATTGAGPDLVCAWRKAQGRDKEGWNQVPVQSLDYKGATKVETKVKTKVSLQRLRQNPLYPLNKLYRTGTRPWV